MYQGSDPAVARGRRTALMALFFLPGLVMASWVSRTPDIRDALEASPGQMGLILMGLSVGSMVGILSSGPLVARFGTRPVLNVTATATAFSVLVIALGAGMPSAWVLALGLGISGLAMGAAEVAMNVEGAEIEALGGKPFLTTLHAFFSIGATVGASIGIAFTHYRVPVGFHIVSIAVLAFVLVPLALPRIPHGTGRSEPLEPGTARRRSVADTHLVLVGVIILALALAEGAANDWLPLVMVDGHGFDPALGSLSYAIFAACMAVGRLFGGSLVTRLGNRNVLLISALSGALGLALIIFVDNQVVAAAAVIAWGFGAALGFPVAVSEAGSSGPEPARRVALVATVAYVAFLAGPPVLGLVGEAVGLRHALILVLGLCAIAAVVTMLLRQAPVRPSRETASHH